MHENCTLSSFIPHKNSSHHSERRLTGVEVFGFRQLDGGSRLLLQLDDGLTSFPDDGTRRIAGNQNLQEVLAFLCSGEQGNRKSNTATGVGSLLQNFKTQERDKKQNKKKNNTTCCVKAQWVRLNLCPHARLLAFVTALLEGGKKKIMEESL